MAATQNYLGKCKECDYVIFATGEDVQDADNFRAVTAGTGVYRVGNNGCFARCSNRHKFFACKPVKGTYSESHQCDSRCLNAKGWDCTCSCGGANHGRGHVAIITQASAITVPVTAEDFRIKHADAPERVTPTPAPVLKHLGTLGEHITGEVFVKAMKTLSNGSTLYTFRAVNGGHIVKWFAPEYIGTPFEVGRTFKLRAKVKAHNDFQGVPETLVTYVEEVE